ncbi:MAG: hypothetical protein VX115_06660, partial [Candidatus Thermoplasmatota archaeon]|nr:hypothetical protein [Candidatus Thermoplasmatota archaeon]
KIRKEGKLLEFSIVEGETNQPVLEFLEQEKVRLKSIEKDLQNNSEAKMDEQEGVKTSIVPTLHTRSRSQKSLFDFGEDSNDPWNPVLDGRDINRQ